MQNTDATFYALKGPTANNIKTHNAILKQQQLLQNCDAHILMLNNALAAAQLKRPQIADRLANMQQRLPKYFKYLKF